MLATAEFAHVNPRNFLCVTQKTQKNKMVLTRTGALRNLLHSPKLEYLMEAHNGLSARIVENTGFKGIWASGLSMSASMCTRDCNEASWSQLLDIVEQMTYVTKIPVLVDSDTGFGNFNNARYFARKAEQRNVAGICIEDKLFPKTNSFIEKKQPLADLKEFTNKIEAVKEFTNDLVVVARCEAFIGGHGLEEALKRCEKYMDAGADALFVHSKRKDAKEIEDFMTIWNKMNKRIPIIVCPTTFYTTPSKHFEEIGVSTVIWANHNLRASISAMKKTSQAIFESQSIAGVEKEIASVKDVFTLQDEEELKQAEKKYF